MSPEEISAVFEAYNNAIKSGTPVSQDMANALKNATKGVKGYAEAQQNAMSKLGKSLGDITKAAYDGEQGLTGMASAAESAGGAALDLLSAFGPLGIIAGMVGKALLKFGKLAAEQSDKLFKTYQDLSESGAAAAGGMTEIFQNMQKFGYGLKEIDQMTALIRESSKELAAFGGTAASGTRAFADAAAQIQRSNLGEELQMLGKTPDQINKGMLQFVKLQQLAGVSSVDIQNNLANKSADYIKQIERLSRLTGESADAIQQNRQRAMDENAFNKRIFDLKRAGLAGDEKSLKLANEYLKASDMMISTPVAQGEFWRSIGGDISASTKSLLTLGDSALYVQDENFEATKYIDMMAKAAENFAVDGMSSLFAFNGALDNVALPMKEYGIMISRYSKESAEAQSARADAEQEAVLKGLDPATKEQVRLRLAQQRTRDSLQSFVNLGVNPATDALGALASTASRASSALPGTVAGGSSMQGQSIGGGGATGNSLWQSLFGFLSIGGGNTVDKILQTIKNRESSGGNYTAQSPESSASGAYQFIDKTWQSLTTKYGIGQEYAKAKLAPKDIQDAIARKYVEEILKEAGGDVSKVPLAWYTGNIRGDLEGAQISAGHPSVDAYQRQWMNDFARTSGVSGPSNSFDSKLTGLNPKTSLPNKETTVVPTPAPDDSEASIWSTIRDSLESIDRKMSGVEGGMRKVANHAGG